MKVLVITPLYPTWWHPHSGVFVSNFVSALKSFGQIEIEVVRVTSIYQPILGFLGLKWIRNGFSNKSKFKLTLTNHLGIPYLTYTRFRKYNQAHCYYKIRKLLEKRSYDIQYCHFFESLYLLYLTGKLKNAIVVLGESNVEAFARIGSEEIAHNVLKCAKRIVCVSKSNKNKILKKFPDLEEQVAFIPNGVNQTIFRRCSKLREGYRMKLGLGDPGVFLVVTVGQFTKRKGTKIVLNALNLDYNFQIKGAFFGNGPERPNGERVIFANSVENPQLPGYLNAGDVFILPSLAEGMSNAILEAAACGLPLVVSDRQFNREFIPSESALFVDPLNPKEIGKAIKLLHDDIELRKRLVNESLALAERFSMNNRVRAMRNILLESCE